MDAVKKLLINSLVFIVGLVFIVSAYTKMFNTASFAEIISSYGFSYLSFLAPVIVVFELLLGLHLIFFVKVKKVLIIAIVTFIVFTTIFSYGFFIKGIESCGCFGNFWSDFLDKPTVVFTRNFILIIFSYIALRYYKPSIDNDLKLKTVIIYAVTAFAIFISGYTYKSARKISSVDNSKFINKTVDEIGLNQFYNFSNDSTYIAFIFSYSCPHCLNTVANINLYKEYNYIDNIIYLPVGSGQARAEFDNNFAINGVRIDSASEDISRISGVFPTILFVKNNNVIFVNEGVISAPMVFFRRNNLIFNKE